MSRLLRDRYFACAAGHGWDLATGDRVPLDDAPDEAVGRQPALASLVEVLDHGREGAPRWVVLDRPPGSRLTPVIRRVADAARSRGFVPVAVDLYLRLREVLVDEFHDRTLLLIARPGLSQDLARTALLDAAARAPRPHVLLTFARERGGAPDDDTRANLVREARVVYAPQALRPRPAEPLSGEVMRQVLRGLRAAEFARTGRHAAAERLLRDVAAALMRRRAPAAASQALVSLGRLLLERGRARDADDVFGEAAAQGDAAHDEALTIDARIWQAAARTDAGRLTGAEAVCRAVLVTTSLSAAGRARAEAALGRVLLWQGRAEEAAELPIIAAACEDASFAYVGATAVRLLLEAGRVFEAGLRAREIVAAVETSGDSLTRFIALTAHVRVLLAAGDLALAEERMRELRRWAGDARATLRFARVRLLWAEALRRAGRDREAKREGGYLRRIRAVAPTLLQGAIDRHLRHESPPSGTPTPPRPSTTSAASALIALAQREGDDRTALIRLFEYTVGALRCSRLDLCSVEAGVVTVTTSCGAGLPTRLGSRVLEAGIAIGPEDGDPGREIGWPVRLGPRLLAAIVVRWPADTAPPPHPHDLLGVMAAVASPRIESLLASAREESQAAAAIPELVGGSAGIAELRKAVARAASAPFAVLIEGESGVGKELVARAIHHLSPRRQRRFCDVNCAALPDDLIESELFGHARGAFTGAVADRAGLVEDADGGTLFLDEVADLSPRAQAKLLRVIQQQEVRRVGESFSRKVDVRVVSAANRDMRTEAEAGRFRQDLLYRLEVVRVRIPALRERPEDIATLARHFWRDAAGRVGTSALLTHGVLTALARYHWPGNVRELQNVMAALAVAAPSRGQVRPALLPAVITGAAGVTSPRLADARAQFERRFIEVALARAGGSRSRAAREMGISRQGLLKLMARVGLVSS